MNLHETYATLVRRGMPKHPDIFNAGSYLAHSACEYDGRNGCLSGSDTRDLITMHALRWLATLRSETPKIYKPEININWYEHDDCVNLSMTQVKGGPQMHYKGHLMGRGLAEALLEHIVAATAHLEPK